RTEAIFVLEADDSAEWQRQVQKLRAQVSRSSTADIDALAGAWWQTNPNDPRKTLGVAVVASSAADLAQQLDRLPPVAAHPLPPVPRVAFVFPGSGNH